MFFLNDFQNLYNKEMYVNYKNKLFLKVEMLKYILLKLKFKIE